MLVNFTDQSSGAIVYNWNFGDSNFSSSTNPVNTFTTNGTYVVTLIVTAGPCSDTATTTIIVESGLSLEIPNVFTPNNDGTNDFFTIKSSGVKEITLQVFNRWGEKLYDFSGAKAAWDGLTGQGGVVPDGTYFYFVKATGFDDKEIEKNGTVNLFR
jgi:gliding motility-associated-like protein